MSTQPRHAVIFRMDATCDQWQNDGCWEPAVVYYAIDGDTLEPLGTDLTYDGLLRTLFVKDYSVWSAKDWYLRCTNCTDGVTRNEAFHVGHHPYCENCYENGFFV